MYLIQILILGISLHAFSNFEDPESCIKALYRYVSVDPGESCDWDFVESCFIADPVIVLRTSRDSSSIMSIEDFINDFKNFVEKANITESGFQEKIIKMKAFEVGNVASFHVVYEALIPESGREALRGIDMIHLVKTEAGWKISSIVNDILVSGEDNAIEMKDIPLN